MRYFILLSVCAIASLSGCCGQRVVRQESFDASSKTGRTTVIVIDVNSVGVESARQELELAINKLQTEGYELVEIIPIIEGQKEVDTLFRNSFGDGASESSYGAGWSHTKCLMIVAVRP